MVTRDDVVEAARSYLGVRFKKYGRTKEGGFDCVGLLLAVGNDLGLPVEDLKGYAFDPIPQVFMSHIGKQTTFQRKPTHGSIALLRQSVYPMHTGIIAKTPNGFTIINAHMGKRKVIEQPARDWDGLIIQYRDFQGIV